MRGHRGGSEIMDKRAGGGGWDGVASQAVVIWSGDGKQEKEGIRQVERREKIEAVRGTTGRAGSGRAGSMVSKRDGMVFKRAWLSVQGVE